MQQNQNRPTSAPPMLNYRKRPRQTLMSDPQAGQTGSIVRPGPSGAATYPDLMPVGGFNGNIYQRGRFPTSGRGAADFNRNTNYNAYSNPSTGRSYPSGSTQNIYAQNFGSYQQNHSGNTLQNRSLAPTGRGRSWIQSQNTVTDINSYSQNGPRLYGSSTSGYGYNTNTWNGNQQAYGNNRITANNNIASSYGQPGSARNYQQQQVRNQSNSTRQGKGRGGVGQNRQDSYRTNSFANTPANQAVAISDEWDNSFNEPATTLPQQGANNVTKDTVKVINTDKTAVSEVKKSLHFLTMDVAGVKRWSKFKDPVQIMFEVFGQLDSAIARTKTDCKEFLIRDEKKNAITCIFYEIDRQLPKVTRGQWYRIIGTYDGRKEQFKCFSIRALQPTEGNLSHLLTQKSTEIMCKLTRNMREH